MKYWPRLFSFLVLASMPWIACAQDETVSARENVISTQEGDLVIHDVGRLDLLPREELDPPLLAGDTQLRVDVRRHGPAMARQADSSSALVRITEAAEGRHVLRALPARVAVELLDSELVP